MADKEDVLEQLKMCYDPEIPLNIVDLGLIYDVTIEADGVDVTMTLTSVGCPVADQMKAQVKSRVKQLEDVSRVNCEIVYDPPWTRDMVTEEGEATLSTMGIV